MSTQRSALRCLRALLTAVALIATRAHGAETDRIVAVGGAITEIFYALEDRKSVV